MLFSTKLGDLFFFNVFGVVLDFSPWSTSAWIYEAWSSFFKLTEKKHKQATSKTTKEKDNSPLHVNVVDFLYHKNVFLFKNFFAIFLFYWISEWSTIIISFDFCHLSVQLPQTQCIRGCQVSFKVVQQRAARVLLLPWKKLGQKGRPCDQRA